MRGAGEEMLVQWTRRRGASAAGKTCLRAIKIGLLGSAAVLVIGPSAFANPQGGQVVSGSATITTPTASQTRIEQHSDKVAIDWQSFNIQQGESTVFVQPNSSSVALNRIFD